MAWTKVGNIKGPAGLGVPPGGTTGQVLNKKSATDNDTQWTTPPPAGVTDHGVLTGLTDDDHPQYMTQARGDARYAQPADLLQYLLPSEVIAGLNITVSQLSGGRVQIDGAAGTVGPQGPKGDPGDKGDKGDTGATGAASTVPGPPGQGVAPGGTTGQVLTKIDGTNYNTQWSTATGGTGVNEVFVGPDIPTDGTSELWYDTDAPSPSGASAVPAGTVNMFAGNTVPPGWLWSDGSAVSRTTYAALFAAIGTNHGTGDFTTTFNLPNMISKFPYGTPLLSGVGQIVGSNTHTHPLSGAGGAAIILASSGTFEIRSGPFPAWNPNFNNPTAASGGSGGAGQTVATALMGTTDAGSALPVSMQLAFIIKT